MKVAKSLLIATALACSFNVQAAHSSDFVKNLLGQFSGTIVSWDDLASRHQAAEMQIRQALESGSITIGDADTLRRQLSPVADAIVQGKASGKPLSFTQGLVFAQTLNSVTANLQQAVATKQSALPDIDALQVELSQKIDEALSANQLAGDDATRLKGELRTVADIENTIKTSGNGTLSGKQIETINGRLSDIKTELVQAIKVGQSAMPELNHRLDELRQRVTSALNANKITDMQARHLSGELQRTSDHMRDYMNVSQYLNGKQVLELAGNLDHVANDLHDDIAATAASQTAQAPSQMPGSYPGQMPGQFSGSYSGQTSGQMPNVAITPPTSFPSGLNAVNTTDLGAITDQSGGKKYPDVVGYWGEPYISILASRGVIGGFPDGTFHPNDNITRAQFAAIAVKALSVPQGGGGSSFNDVPAKYWGAGAIGAVSGAGLVTGFPDGTFKPEDKLTRAQALVILAKALGQGYSDQRELANYSDAGSVPGWAAPSVTRAASAHIIASFPDPAAINPNAFATRGEVAALMYQTLLALNKPYPRINIGLLPQYASAAPAGVPPQATQVVTPPVQPAQSPDLLDIANVEVSPTGRLSAGDVLTVRAFGSANAIASFSIRNGVQDVPMDERRDGVYEGQYTVRKTDNIGRTKVIVNLRRGSAQPARGESRRDLMLDAMPPEIAVEPRPNSMSPVQPNIVVRYTDGHGSGVDQSSVHLFVNNQEVTTQSIVDNGMVAFKPNMPLHGIVNAEIKLADRCGNAVDYQWSFNVQ